jgi:hypothetical protein
MPVLFQVSEADQVRYGHDTRRVRTACLAPDHRRDGACEALRQAVRRRSASFRTLRTPSYRLEVAASRGGLVALGPVDSRLYSFRVRDKEHRYLNGAGDSRQRCLELDMVFLEM